MKIMTINKGWEEKEVRYYSTVLIGSVWNQENDLWMDDFDNFTIL